MPNNQHMSTPTETPTTALALPGKPPIVPKATKSEIVAAMVVLAKDEFIKQRKAHQEEELRLVKEHQEMMVVHVRELIATGEFPKVEHFRADRYDSRLDVHVPTEGHLGIKAIRDKIARLKGITWSFDEKEVRKRIVASMDNTKERVQIILDNPENRQHLEMNLKMTFQPPQLAIV